MSLTKGENKAMRRFPDALRRIGSRPRFFKRQAIFAAARAVGADVMTKDADFAKMVER